MDIMKDLLANAQVQQALGTLLLALAGLLATAITGATVGLLRAKTTDNQFNLLQQYAHFATLAAEQAGLSGLVTDKKASAINVVTGYLKSAGITGVTGAEIDAAIEAAVLRNFNAYKTAPPAPQFPGFSIVPTEGEPEATTEPIVPGGEEPPADVAPAA